MSPRWGSITPEQNDGKMSPATSKQSDGDYQRHHSRERRREGERQDRYGKQKVMAHRDWICSVCDTHNLAVLSPLATCEHYRTPEDRQA